MKLAPFFKQRFFDENGAPLAGGFVYTYVANSSTPLGTYSTQDGDANQNPVELDANGEADIWLDPSLSYKVTLADADNVPIWTVDEVSHLVDSDQLADEAVGPDALADEAVTTEKIADEAVTAAKLDPDLVDDETLEIDTNVLQVKDGGITRAKLAALGQQVSSSTDVHATVSTSFVDVSNASVTITTTGRPVWIGVQSDGSGAESNIGVDTAAGYGIFAILRGATEVARHQLSRTTASFVAVPSSSIWHIDTPAAGTYTYKLQMKSSGTTEVYIEYAKLVAYEI